MKMSPKLATVIGKIDSASRPEPNHTPQMAKLPWYPRDFASSTRGWPLLPCGALRELLDAQWDMGSLPADLHELRPLSRATPAQWKVVWKYIEPKFPIGADGRRRNPRLETHRSKQIDQFNSQSAGGRAGNRSRWGDRQ
jgi:hypothetical protein